MGFIIHIYTPGCSPSTHYMPMSTARERLRKRITGQVWWIFFRSLQSEPLHTREVLSHTIFCRFACTIICFSLLVVLFPLWPFNTLFSVVLLSNVCRPFTPPYQIVTNCHPRQRFEIRLNSLFLFFFCFCLGGWVADANVSQCPEGTRLVTCCWQLPQSQSQSQSQQHTKHTKKHLNCKHTEYSIRCLGSVSPTNWLPMFERRTGTSERDERDTCWSMRDWTCLWFKINVRRTSFRLRYLCSQAD